MINISNISYVTEENYDLVPDEVVWLGSLTLKKGLLEYIREKDTSQLF